MNGAMERTQAQLWNHFPTTIPQSIATPAVQQETPDDTSNRDIINFSDQVEFDSGEDYNFEQSDDGFRL
jgi:hypothetical protein